MNIQELKKQMSTVPDHKMQHSIPMKSPMKKFHDITTGKSIKHRALEGAKRIGITEHRSDGGKNYLAPGSGLYKNHEEGKAGAAKALASHRDMVSKTYRNGKKI